MRVACPTCAATYEVPANMFKPGQMVRCARCAKEWAPEPAAEAEAPGTVPVAPQTTSHDAAMETPARPERRPAIDHRLPPPRHVGARVAWVASILLLAALVWAGYSQRTTIMQAWPPSERLYNALGLNQGP